MCPRRSISRPRSRSTSAKAACERLPWKPTDGLGPRNESVRSGRADHCSCWQTDAGPRAERVGSARRQHGPVNTEHFSHSSPGAGLRRSIDGLANVRDGHQSNRSAGTLSPWRENWPVWRRGRRQDGHHSGTNQQHRLEARWRLRVRWCGRAHSRRQRFVAGNAGIACC